MGQKTHPVGFRLGIIKGWDSNWFDEKDASTKIMEDETLRNYVRNRFKKGGVSKVLIERTAKNIRVIILTSRPGIIIGKSGKEIGQLEEELKKLQAKRSKS